MTKFFKDIEELKQCYQNKEDSRFRYFVLEVEQMVEKMITDGLKYNGRIIWDSAYIVDFLSSSTRPNRYPNYF